ncbi:hypothetical protein [Motiliproteus sp. MSK22-1]|uniref:hypothetical protein n=1 Tax=Motiliproteus sp. MSK22-1 TaxID=1897630 RepID=UPI000978BE36|nr:hypothetical protein [Motiliproteus sp. MSK22-1]OMH33855.1 hypothetical protein BGP75_12800 [Motiliproteus sp. MSK22-1]
MTKQWLSKFQGTQWEGKGELWLDPEGNKQERYDCSMMFGHDGLDYTWLYEGETKKGSFTFNKAGGAIWLDSWHQPKSIPCVDVANAWGLFTVECCYEVPSSPSWGWRSKLSERPNGDLVLQMTNIAPWGEEGRAVRMIFTSVADKA